MIFGKKKKETQPQGEKTILHNSDYKRGKNRLLECPCCGNFTIDDGTVGYGEPLEVITDICRVCFWEFDLVAQCNPDMAGGANRVSLNNAKENYNKFGATEQKFKDKVRPPLLEELPENN